MVEGQSLATWAGKLQMTPSELQASLEKESARQDAHPVFENLWLVDFHGVTLADAKILALLPKTIRARPESLENAYTIEEVAGKGMGMVATRDISAGAVILVENPVFVFPIIQSVAGNMPRETLFKTLFDRLDAELRQRARALSNCKPAELCCQEEGVVRTNGFSVPLPIPDGPNPPHANHTATFMDMSRCNHRCEINSLYFSRMLRIWRP